MAPAAACVVLPTMLPAVLGCVLAAWLVLGSCAAAAVPVAPLLAAGDALEAAPALMVMLSLTLATPGMALTRSRACFRSSFVATAPVRVTTPLLTSAVTL